MTAYHVGIASLLGTRRFTWSWWLWKIGYERTLKAHHIVGRLATIYIMLHAGFYIHAFEWELPSHTVLTAIIIGGATLAIFFTTFSSFRVRWYGPFRVVHYLAPVVLWCAVLHVATLNTDHLPSRGLWGTLMWIGLPALGWTVDVLWTAGEMAFARPITFKAARIVPARTVTGSDADCKYVILSFQQRNRKLVGPGTWLSISCPQAQSTLSHPFTAIVQQTGGSGQVAEFSFVLKANQSGWVRRLYDWIERNPKNQPTFFLSGPYGGGIGSLRELRTIVFVVAGVGFTPAASMAHHLRSQGKEIHVVWTFRSLELYQEGWEYFSQLPLDCVHFHLTGAAHVESVGRVARRIVDQSGAYTDDCTELQLGRPSLPDIFHRVATRNARLNIFDIGVFVCGPDSLRTSVAEATKSSSSDTHFHVHAESFQM
jgi:predicted ferric reductase